MNKAILTGWLTDDVALKTVPSGKAVCTFTLAVHKRQKKSEAIFVPIVTWDAVAQSCTKYLKKGSRVLVIGEINIRNYDDAENIKRWVTEIVADMVEFLDRKPKSEEHYIERDEPLPPPDIDEKERME